MEDLLRRELAGLVRAIHGRGWAPGTGGNFSRVVSRDPLRLLVTPSGVDKGQVGDDHLILVDARAQALSGGGRPSAETLLHVPIVEERGAGAVLHTHTVWNTLASLREGDQWETTGFEMLKGLSGVASHEHIEVVPTLDNSQDMTALAGRVRKALGDHPDCHGILLRGHGLYTWGRDILEAHRHLEVLEFLFEVTGRARN